jgi:PTH1 family peptidyl-tRNA hydrolase
VIPKLLQRLLAQQPQQLSNDSWLVVGLGNPGPSYQGNRHNAGQMVLDVLAKRLATNFKSSKQQAIVADARVAPGKPKVILAKPSSFMNLSGTPVSLLAKFYSIPLERVIVVHDEIDIPFGDIRLKFAGGHAGHNGLRDIIAKQGNEFHRLRFGVGRPNGSQEVASFVLENFNSVERKELEVLCEIAADKIIDLISA